MVQTIACLGIPTDINSSFARGSADGPPLIRQALWSDRGNLACESGLEIGADFVLDDRGDLGLRDDPVACAGAIRDAALVLMSDATRPIFWGGDHSVTFPLIEAVHARHGPVSILHIDAHPDLYDDFEGNPFSHASPFARIMERGLASRLMQVGVRTITRHCRSQAERFGVEVIGMGDFAVERVPMVAGPVYVSVDLDGFDPAFAPGVSHPEPGGLTVREVIALLDRLAGPIIGADIVEFNPRFDVNGVTAILAAKLTKEIAARMADPGKQA